jgi:S-ribosylhomocysteine lyase LuxS involved in autoinducer biosynthesis
VNSLKKIESFTIDHTKLVPGIYISRKDSDITTYDMRMRTPNAGDYLNNSTMHSFGGVAKLLKSREAALSFYKYKGKQTLKISC